MAVPEYNVRIDGLEHLNNSLQEISRMYGPRQARNSLRVPMRNAFESVADQIERTTPVDSGRLRESTNLRPQVPTRDDRRRNPGVVYTVKAGWEWTRPSLWSQALAVEYGTRQVSEQRILRSALDDNADRVVAELIPQLANQLDRTARRLRNRQRRAR